LNILIISRFADRRGGADVYTQSLSLRLAQRGHDVRIFCHAASEEVKKFCCVVEFEDPDFSKLKAIWRFGSLLYQRHWRRFLASHATSQPDVIINSLPLSSGDIQKNFPGVPCVYLPHSRIAPIEAVAQVHASRLQRMTYARMFSNWERRSILKAATTVRFTAGNERELRAYYRLPEQVAFDIIPAAVDNYRQDSKPCTNDPIVLLAVCRLVESKNLQWLLQLLASLETRDFKLNIVGDGPEREKLESFAKESGIADQITFHGFCSDMTSVYESADLHVFPSLRESFGLVILEAMAFGVPTLAFMPDHKKVQTASHEIIEHGVDGLLAESEEDFRLWLLECIEKPGDLIHWSEKARQKVVEHHRWDLIAVAWESVLNRLVQTA